MLTIVQNWWRSNVTGWWVCKTITVFNPNCNMQYSKLFILLLHVILLFSDWYLWSVILNDSMAGIIRQYMFTLEQKLPTYWKFRGLSQYVVFCKVLVYKDKLWKTFVILPCLDFHVLLCVFVCTCRCSGAFLDRFDCGQTECNMYDPINRLRCTKKKKRSNWLWRTGI